MEFQGMVMGQYVQSVTAGEPKYYLKQNKSRFYADERHLLSDFLFLMLRQSDRRKGRFRFGKTISTHRPALGKT